MGIIQICSIVVVFLFCLLIFLLIVDAVKRIAFNVTFKLHEEKQLDFEKLACAAPHITLLMRGKIKKVLFNLEKRGIVKKDGDTFSLGEKGLKALFITMMYETESPELTPYPFANKFKLYIKDVEDLLEELESDGFVKKEGRSYSLGANVDELLI